MSHDANAIRISTDAKVATIWIDWTTHRDDHVNALSLARLVQLVQICQKIAENPSYQLLILRSAKPVFCGGWQRQTIQSLQSSPDAIVRSHCVQMQQLIATVRTLPLTTLAVLEGPCAGPGFDLALMCDYRLAVASPDLWLGFDLQPTGCGGATELAYRFGRATARLFAGRLTAREARDLGVIDLACCERRIKIDLQQLTTKILKKPLKRPEPWNLRRFHREEGLRDECRQFLDCLPSLLDQPVPSLTLPLPRSMAIDRPLQAHDPRAGLVIECLIRGVTVYADGSIPKELLLHRQRVTPLEATQALNRLRPRHEATSYVDWILSQEIIPDSSRRKPAIEWTIDDTVDVKEIERQRAWLERLGYGIHWFYSGRSATGQLTRRELPDIEHLINDDYRGETSTARRRHDSLKVTT